MAAGEITKPLGAQFICIRCTHTCIHVEAAGIWYCPNCGTAKDIKNDPQNRVTYTFWNGCKACNLPGRGYKGTRTTPINYKK